MSKTFNALLAKGVNSRIAKNIVQNGYTLSTLSSLSQEKLEAFGVDENLKHKIFDSGRPDIPEQIIDNLLYKSRRTCCICRESDRSIIIHHIIEWKKSKSNSEENLVVLCLQHHDEAHTVKDLSQNLTPKRVKSAKEIWEKRVIELEEQVHQLTFKELTVIPKHLSELKKQWFNFLKKLNIPVEIPKSSLEQIKFDFEINGVTKLKVKVFPIKKIEDLLNRNRLVEEINSENYLDSVLVLGLEPFISSDGFYANEKYFQIGWLYSFGEDDWDNIVLKSNYDISNSKFFIKNLIYPNGSYKNFLPEEEFNKLINKWSEQ